MVSIRINHHLFTIQLSLRLRKIITSIPIQSWLSYRFNNDFKHNILMLTIRTNHGFNQDQSSLIHDSIIALIRINHVFNPDQSWLQSRFNHGFNPDQSRTQSGSIITSIRYNHDLNPDQSSFKSLLNHGFNYCIIIKNYYDKNSLQW